MEDRIITVHLEITGRVQGVGFRESMCAVARALGVRGWVRNCAQGSVEALVQGRQKEVDRLLAWCGNGPPAAWVGSVQVDPVERAETFPAFTRRPSV